MSQMSALPFPWKLRQNLRAELKDIVMSKERLAKGLLVAAALSTLIIPIVTDAVLLANAHMNNPAWLPHAKLHCAMSFFAAASLGLAALAVLKARSLFNGTCCVSRLRVLDWANRLWTSARNLLRVSQRSGFGQCDCASV